MNAPLVRAACVVLLLLFSSAGRIEAQDRLCRSRAPGRTESVGGQIIVFHDPFTFTCDDGAELRADSGRLDQATRELTLNGNVLFRDPDRSLTANEAIYNSQIQRLWASGNVVFDNRSEGSTLRGPELEYFRATEERPEAEVIAPRRPTLTMRPGSDTNSGDEPLVLVADRVLIHGEDNLNATGSVVITRSDLDAVSQEADYNSATELLELRQAARITNPDYSLSGENIRIRMRDGELQNVRSRINARMDGEDSRVEAPDLQLFFAGDTLKQAVAVRGRDSTAAQARAWSSDFELRADSIQADFLRQRIQEVRAIGVARAESMDSASAPAPGAGLIPADSLGASPAQLAVAGGPPRSDWLVGDTILAYFDVPDSIADTLAVNDVELPLPAPDTTALSDSDQPEEVELRLLIAIGSAQSLYRMAPEESPDAERRNINFLVGDRIELELRNGELQVADVQGLKRGVFLEAREGGGGGVPSVNAVAPVQVADPPPADTAPPPDADPDSAAIPTEPAIEPATAPTPSAVPSLLGVPAPEATVNNAQR